MINILHNLINNKIKEFFEPLDAKINKDRRRHTRAMRKQYFENNQTECTNNKLKYTKCKKLLRKYEKDLIDIQTENEYYEKKINRIVKACNNLVCFITTIFMLWTVCLLFKKRNLNTSQSNLTDVSSISSSDSSIYIPPVSTAIISTEIPIDPPALVDTTKPLLTQSNIESNITSSTSQQLGGNPLINVLNLL